MFSVILLLLTADLASVDDQGATAWDYARGRQLHYCMLIIASYIRQRAQEGTLMNGEGDGVGIEMAMHDEVKNHFEALHVSALCCF